MSLTIHIVPQLPPAISGVGDYAVLVGSAMEDLSTASCSRYIACGHVRTEHAPARTSRDATGACEPSRLWQEVRETAGELGHGSERTALIVHYSGYGYDRNGAPGWLAEALERLPRDLQDVRVVTMFHELYATSWPWRRAFWHSLRQRIVAARIARASDAIVTNREASARWLERACGLATGSVASLPITSNVGEPGEIVPWMSRARVAVMFGSARFKRPFLVGRGARNAVRLCRHLEIETLVSIGAPTEFDEKTFKSNGIEVVQTGIISAAEISSHYRAARFALVDYFAGYYSKSGVLAAAASHGTPPVFPREDRASDGLKFGEHLWDLQAALKVGREDALTRLRSISQSIRRWYEGHTVQRHARLLLDATCPKSMVAG